MTAVVTDLNELQQMISKEKFVEKGFPAPVRTSILVGSDHSGEEAYYIYVVYPDHTTDEDLDYKKIKPILNWIHETIWGASGAERWPYIRIRRESEMDSNFEWQSGH